MAGRPETLGTGLVLDSAGSADELGFSVPESRCPASGGAGPAVPSSWAPVFAMRVLDAPETVCDFGLFRNGDIEARVSSLLWRRAACPVSRGSEVGRRGCRPSRETGGRCPPALGLAIPATGWFGPVWSCGRRTRAPRCLHPEARDPTLPSPWALLLGDACASLTGVLSRPRAVRGRRSRVPGFLTPAARVLSGPSRGDPFSGGAGAVCP